MGFLASRLNDIFQLYVHLEIVSRSFARSLALSSLFLTTEKREVSSANNLTLDFNPSGKSLIYILKKTKVSKWILEELPKVQVMISSWFTHEYDGRKPDWFVLRRFFQSRKE